MPIFWIAGEDMGILVPLVHGATVVLLARWDATAVLSAVERYRMSVFPSEVEALLARHPDALGVAVVPMPHRDKGQLPLAFVQPVPGAGLAVEALTGWARQNMASYKVPRFMLVPELPMTATGKIKKGDLLERAQTFAEGA